MDFLFWYSNWAFIVNEKKIIADYAKSKHKESDELK